MVYGRDPPPLIHGILSALPNSAMDQLLQDCDSMLTILRKHLVRAQQHMKSSADERQCDMSFQVDDLVYLKLRPYHLSSLAHRVNEQLAPNFCGPFPVTEHIGAVAYRLQLPPTSSIHRVFHISQLRPAVGSPPPCPGSPYSALYQPRTPINS